MKQLILRLAAVFAVGAITVFLSLLLVPPLPVGHFLALLEDLAPSSVEWEGDCLVVTLPASSRSEALFCVAETVQRVRLSSRQPRDLWVEARDRRHQLLYWYEKENIGIAPLPFERRAETLEEELTLFKLKYELEQFLGPCETQMFGYREGKLVKVTLSPEEDISTALTVAPEAVRQVNREGGGIVRMDLYRGAELLCSMDLRFGDIFI